MLTVDEYVFVEEKYINTISTILEYYSCNSLIIKNLERGLEANELYPIFSKIGLKLEENEITFLESLAEDVVIGIDDIKEVLICLLREIIWCSLESIECEVKLEFGYDYYVYITCKNIPLEIIQSAKEIGIFIEMVETQS